MRRLLKTLIVLLLFSQSFNSITAYELPSINLGFTSFLDGGPPAGPGLYFTQYLHYISSDKLTNSDGDNALPSFAGEELRAFISLTQFIYQSDKEIFKGARPGIDVIIPTVSLDMSYENGNPNFPQDNGVGLGDILVGPYIQWDPVVGKNGPKFMQRVEFQFILPTGKYDKNKALNPGSNFFSFNPYWAGTYFFTPKLTASTRIHYLWNAKNDDVNRYGEIMVGQAIHANFATAYEVIPKRLRVGLNGYYLKQITGSEFDGKSVDDSKEEVFAAGPGFLYHHSKDSHFFFNSYFETGAKKRAQGYKINLRFVHHF